MNETAAKTRPRTSQSHGNGLNGACSGAFRERSATLNSDVDALADATSGRPAASLARFSAGAGVGDGRRLNAAPGELDADDGERSCRSTELWGAAGADVAPPLA
jgi:hypothetical protein